MVEMAEKSEQGRMEKKVVGDMADITEKKSLNKRSSRPSCSGTKHIVQTWAALSFSTGDAVSKGFFTALAGGFNIDLVDYSTEFLLSFAF